MNAAPQIVLYGVPLSALIITLVAFARYQGLPSHYAPPLSLVLGILGGVAAQYHVYQLHGTPDWLFGVISGVVLGLTASGAYSHLQVYVSAGTIPRPDKPTPAPVVSPAATPVEPPAA